MRVDQRSVLATTGSRLDGVDLIRGAAILFVLMNHVNMQLLFAHVPYTKGLPNQLVSFLVWNGQYGVQMFFAVSGFLITSTSLRRWGSLGSVRPGPFYLLRFARIAPLFFLLLAVLAALHGARVNHFIVSRKVGGLGSALLAALTFRVNVLEATRGYLPGSWDILWSLSVEEMFYLLFPWACRLLGRSQLLIALLLGLVVAGPFARTLFSHGNEVWHEYSYLGAMDAIALGCLTAMLLATTSLPQRTRWTCVAAGFALVLLILCFPAATARLGLVRSGLDMTLLAAGTCMLIAVAAQPKRSATKRSATKRSATNPTATAWTAPWLLRPVIWLGQRSYEVYLSHMFVVLGVFALYVALGKPLRAVAGLFLTVILLSGLLGWLIARFGSEPMNRLLRRRFAGATDHLGPLTGRLGPATPLATPLHSVPD